jgi:hypothetical protein
MKQALWTQVHDLELENHALRKKVKDLEEKLAYHSSPPPPPIEP